MSLALEIEAVSKSFGAKAAVRSASMKVADGDLHALLGPSRCGKTTNMQIQKGLDS